MRKKALRTQPPPPEVLCSLYTNRDSFETAYFLTQICVYGALTSLWRVVLKRYGSAERIRWFLYVQKPEIAFDLVTLPIPPPPTPLFFPTHQTLQEISHFYFPLSQQTGIYWRDDVKTYFFSPKSLNILQLRSCTSTSETLEGGSVCANKIIRKENYHCCYS